MNSKTLYLITLSLLLVACHNKPVSYLPSGTTPIVNIESPLDKKIDADAQPFLFKVTNRTHTPLNVMYKLFWYDSDGVTQAPAIGTTPWHNFWLQPHAKHVMHLAKPTKETANYRVYLRQGE